MESKVLGVVYRAEGRGVTCDEAEVATGWSHQTVSARINGLMRKDMIADSGSTRRTRSGRSAIVWVSRHLVPKEDPTPAQPLPEVRPVAEAKAVQRRTPTPLLADEEVRGAVRGVCAQLEGLTIEPGKTCLYVQNGMSGVFAPAQAVVALANLIDLGKKI